jgi:hypothetical protein
VDDLHKLECVAWKYVRWETLIRDMMTSGMSPCAIAHALAVPPSSPYNWLKGTEPRYSHGEAILLLHSKVFGMEFSRNRIREFRQAAINGERKPKGASHAENSSSAIAGCR